MTSIDHRGSPLKSELRTSVSGGEAAPAGPRPDLFEELTGRTSDGQPLSANLSADGSEFAATDWARVRSRLECEQLSHQIQRDDDTSAATLKERERKERQAKIRGWLLIAVLATGTLGFMVGVVAAILAVLAGDLSPLWLIRPLPGPV